MNMLSISKRNRILSPSKLVKWFFSLESFTSSGISVMQALNMMQSNPESRGVAKQLQSYILEGDSLTQAMEKTGVFDAFSLSIVESGERSGRLEEAFLRLEQFYEYRASFRKDLIQAMYYPLLILSCILFLLLFIIFYFVPSVMNMYGSNLSSVQAASVPVIQSCLILRQYFFSILYTISLFLFTIFYLIKAYFQTRTDLPLFFYLPVMGEVFQKQKLNEILWSLSLMLESGIDILNSLQIIQNTQKNLAIQKRIQELKAEIASGNSLTEGVLKIGMDDENLSYFIRLGEETGDLAGKLRYLSDIYRREIQKSYQYIATMIQPFMVILMVVLVGALTIGVVLPLLDMDLLYPM